jgi:hypothetical protein
MQDRHQKLALAVGEVDLKKVSKEMRTSPSPLGFALPKEVYVFIGLAAVLIIGATVFYGIKWTRARRRGADEILTVAKIKKALTKALQNAGEWRRTAFLCSELLRRYAFKKTLYPFVDTTTAEAERDISRWAVNLPKNVSDKQLLGLLNRLDELKFSPENLLSETQRQSINDLTQQAIQWMENYDDAVQRNQTQPS